MSQTEGVAITINSGPPGGAPARFAARVLENRALGRGAFVLALDGCAGLAGARPGQFVMLRGAWGRDPLLPRAFSILGLRPGGVAEILVKAVGRGTRLFELALPGAPMSVLGPLGRPFPAPEADDLLVAGGVGLAPLLWLAEEARALARPLELCYGARSAADLVLLDEIAGTGCALHLATEDGTRGERGRVTVPFEARLAARIAAGARPRVLTCGPNPMMRAVVAIARAHGAACLVSVEGEMACGVGACLGCAVPLVAGERPFAYACTDGPVFAAERIEIP
jgi:dihydroorotate dehydrogenase electron transfer subunit